MLRSLKQTIPALATSDGAGVRIKRSLGQRQSVRMDPFLMLDEFGSDQPQDYIAGFPAHPHRGFETVTYMIEGHMLHEDHLGNRGNLRNGGVEQSQLEQPYAWSMLGKNDREYLKRNSDSIVFWHEVAHCNTDQSAEYLATQGKGDQQLTDWNENQEQARQACADPGLLEQWSSTMESRRLTATRPEDLATGEIDPTAMNQMIHFELLKESVADQVGTLISQKRREKRIAGCASKTYVSHPWYRYRLASSVREPDARYMTWISPWLSNLPEPSIHQVLRDSHRGLMLEAKDSLPKPLWMELNHSRSSRPDQHRITDPAGPADSSRASAWKAWISEQLDRSKGEIDLGKN